jgi:predicted PurR-regulated permease PerM
VCRTQLILPKHLILIIQIATQAENLVNQLETITQLRRELNQWKDQTRNWQEHFLRVEEERCAHFSRIDEFIIEKLERFQVRFV